VGARDGKRGGWGEQDLRMIGKIVRIGGVVDETGKQ